MEANVFISKLKADGSKNDVSDLDHVFKEFKEILTKLTTKDRGPFSLNLLCILCRNLEKVPSWRAAIDNKSLVALSIECTRETRTLNQPELVKTLACIYHIHRHIVKQNSPIPPELVLKLSYMPFEMETLITEYCKTYWNILADRIIYIEKLKTKKLNILKLFQKLSEDILKVMKIYNTLEFCSTILTFLMKKIHYLYHDLDPKQLNTVFGRIFEEIQKKHDLRSFKKLQDKQIFEVYVKLNDCLYVVVENSSKIHFEDSVLVPVIQTFISIVGHQQDLLHCLQNMFLNGLCTILDKNQNSIYKETVLSNFVTSCETTEKLGYTKAINATYPYINQFLRLYIEYNIANHQKNWQKLFPEQMQIACLKLMEFLLKKLRDCEQILKCENCTVKSGLHDALRLSFLVKNFITVPLQEDMSITKILPLHYSIVQHQYVISKDLCMKGCINYEKFYRKLQADIHNAAIMLNKSQVFEYSIKLFEIYLQNEILHFKNENDLKNISRALYNKSICELDFKQYENALLDAYLSLVFAHPEGLTTEKYMSLVMDIKAKLLKRTESDCEPDSAVEEMQMMTVVDACAVAVERRTYGNLAPFFCNLKFSVLLKHEFDMYVKLWPSIVPIAGVWKTLHDLTQHDVPWSNVIDDAVKQTLYDVIQQTPTAVRTIYNEHYSEVVTELLETFESTPEDVESKILYATLLFLKAEFDLREASQKFGWKPSELNRSVEADAERDEVSRTLAHEHEASARARRAARVWPDVATHVHEVPKSSSLQFALHTAQVFVPQLLHLFSTLDGLQLASACCQIALHIGDKTSYVTNAGFILYYANRQTDEITEIIRTASQYCKEMLETSDSVEAALVFLCDCALYYNKIGLRATSAKLTQAVQAKLLFYYKNKPDLSLELAVGRLFEVEVALTEGEGAGEGVGGGPGLLFGVIGAQRHYLTIGNSATKWSHRRFRSLTVKLHVTHTGILAASCARHLLLWRRARSSAAVAAAAAAASATALHILFATTTNTSHVEDATVKIDNRLKYILGIQPSSDQPILPAQEIKSNELFTPKQEIETMLENFTFKKTQSSPTLQSIDRVPGFKLPEFFKHDLNCTCFACQNHYSFLLACRTATLEAAMYFRAKEYDIARNYFDGSLKCLELASKRLQTLKMTTNFDGYLVKIVEKILNDEFVNVQIETFIEMAFFELSQEDYESADKRIVTLHEILQENENVSSYLINEIWNLMTTSARLRKITTQKVTDFNLEAEFENLKLSPAKQVEAPKTPEAKAEKPPKIDKIKVKDEEVPNTKRRVIKLILDENSSDEKEASTKKKTSKRTGFKIPVPVVAKPVLESITPTPRSRSRKPQILLTQPSEEEPSTSVFEFATPKPKNADKSEFFTPVETPGDQYFTPMSTLKTYSKKTLRHGIVKNLESEFATPKSEVKKSAKTALSDSSTDSKELPKAVDKENQKSNSDIPKTRAKNVERGSVKSLKDKRSLKRATSPGKLEKTERRTRRPVKFNLDDDK